MSDILNGGSDCALWLYAAAVGAAPVQVFVWSGVYPKRVPHESETKKIFTRLEICS